MSDPQTVYPVSDAFAADANVTRADYERDYAESIRDPVAFRAASRSLEWMTPPTQIRDVSFDREDFRIRWFADGELNVSVNCLDRHLATRATSHAPHLRARQSRWRRQRVSYRELQRAVCRWPTRCATSASPRVTASPSTCR